MDNNTLAEVREALKYAEAHAAHPYISIKYADALTKLDAMIEGQDSGADLTIAYLKGVQDGKKDKKNAESTDDLWLCRRSVGERDDDGATRYYIYEPLEPYVQGWQPIETAPKTGQVIIMAGKTKHGCMDHVGQGHWYRIKSEWCWHNYIGDRPQQPTHWMPLPTAPHDRAV